jgi:hypothetical protein
VVVRKDFVLEIPISHSREIVHYDFTSEGDIGFALTFRAESRPGVLVLKQRESVACNGGRASGVARALSTGVLVFTFDNSSWVVAKSVTYNVRVTQVQNIMRIGSERRPLRRCISLNKCFTWNT